LGFWVWGFGPKPKSPIPNPHFIKIIKFFYFNNFEKINIINIIKGFIIKLEQKLNK